MTSKWFLEDRGNISSRTKKIKVSSILPHYLAIESCAEYQICITFNLRPWRVRGIPSVAEFVPSTVVCTNWLGREHPTVPQTLVDNVRQVLCCDVQLAQNL